MSKPATIGRLAREAAIPVSTLPFWEREGLLRPDARTAARRIGELRDIVLCTDSGTLGGGG